MVTEDTTVRKTIDVGFLKNEINCMLASGTVSKEYRFGQISILELVLHSTGNYNGFRYLTQEEIPPHCDPGINEVDEYLFEHMEDKQERDDAIYRQKFAYTDETRRYYF